MKYMGFNFRKISIERKEEGSGELKINTNIEIKDLEKAHSEILPSGEEIIIVRFEYNIDYLPNYAKIEFKGDIILSIESKKAKELLDDWKDKKIKEDIRVGILNIILKKANIKALELEDEMNLPLHMPLFKIKRNNEIEE